jgi:hypothetical protein
MAQVPGTTGCHKGLQLSWLAKKPWHQGTAHMLRTSLP